MIIGWGVPAIIVAITVGINKTDNYGDNGEMWVCL